MLVGDVEVFCFLQERKPSLFCIFVLLIKRRRFMMTGYVGSSKSVWWEGTTEEAHPAESGAK